MPIGCCNRVSKTSERSNMCDYDFRLPWLIYLFAQNFEMYTLASGSIGIFLFSNFLLVYYMDLRLITVLKAAQCFTHFALQVL